MTQIWPRMTDPRTPFCSTCLCPVSPDSATCTRTLPALNHGASLTPQAEQSHIPSCSVPHNQTRADTTSHPHTQLGHTHSQLLYITLQTITLSAPGPPLLPCLLSESCRLGEGAGPCGSLLPPVHTHTHTHTHTHKYTRHMQTAPHGPCH